MLITLTRSEGPNDSCFQPCTFKTFGEANAQLRLWANTAPEHGGYDKVDFKIVGQTFELNYKGRYDLKHWRVQIADLKQHVMSHLAFIAGEACPSRMTQEEYKEMLNCIYKSTDAKKQQMLAVREILRNRP